MANIHVKIVTLKNICISYRIVAKLDFRVPSRIVAIVTANFVQRSN